MFSIVERRRWFFLLSGVVILIGIVAMAYSVVTLDTHTPFPLGVDFQSGTRFVFWFREPISEGTIREVFARFDVSNPSFRQVPNAFRYGVCAIAAMMHDILVTMGFMAIAGLLMGWEADALFLTAMLTVIGFSVQDTIVVFDRIRENIPKRKNEAYETIVNRSILETLHRSLATQLNAIFVMVALLLFGGASIQQFIAVLLVGMVSGTYSSIFTAVPLLVAWEKGELPLVG